MGYIKKVVTKSDVVKVLKNLGNKNLCVGFKKILWIADKDYPFDNYVTRDMEYFSLNHNTNLGWYWQRDEDGGKKFLDDQMARFNEFLANGCSNLRIVGFDEIGYGHTSKVYIKVAENGSKGVAFDEEIVELVKGLAKGDNRYSSFSKEDDQIDRAREIVDKYL